MVVPQLRRQGEVLRWQTRMRHRPKYHRGDVAPDRGTLTPPSLNAKVFLEKLIQLLGAIEDFRHEMSLLLKA